MPLVLCIVHGFCHRIDWNTRKFHFYACCPTLYLNLFYVFASSLHLLYILFFISRAKVLWKKKHLWKFFFCGCHKIFTVLLTLLVCSIYCWPFNLGNDYVFRIIKACCAGHTHTSHFNFIRLLISSCVPQFPLKWTTYFP